MEVDILEHYIEGEASVEDWLRASDESPLRQWDKQAINAAKVNQCSLLRCIYGNPFHPCLSAPGCHTIAVVRLAQEAYNERELPSGHLKEARITALATALEESGYAD
jgi:hypothetical protein